MFLITMRELSRPRRNSRAIAQVDRPDSGRRLFHSRHARTFLRGPYVFCAAGKALELVQEVDPRLPVARGIAPRVDLPRMDMDCRSPATTLDQCRRTRSN